MGANNTVMNADLNVNKGLNKRKTVKLSVLLANARSLAPKMESLIEYFTEHDLHAAIITESWLKDGEALEEAKTDLEMGEDISIIHRNRRSKRGRTAGGGVLIAYNKSSMRLKEVPIKRGQAEIVCATGKIVGLSRKVVTMSIYLPPKLSSAKAREAVGYASSAIGRLKDEMEDPLFFIGGDFNGLDISDLICDFPDIRILDSPATRSDERLDLLLANIPDKADVLVTKRRPLQTKDGKLSDHDALLMEMTATNSDRFKITYREIRPVTKKGTAAFNAWIKEESWSDVLNQDGANQMASAMVSKIDNAMNTFFPKKKIKVKSTEDPWITPQIKAKIRGRKRVFDEEHRSDRWHIKKIETSKLIKESKSEYYQQFLKMSKENKDPSLYYKMLNRLKAKNGSKTRFEVCDLFEGQSEGETAEAVADFFTSISDGFTALREEDVPNVPIAEDCIVLSCNEVKKRIKECKKPKGLLSGDLFPFLLSNNSDLIAEPLTRVLNAAFAEEIWPDVWKLETVSVIPKNPCPESLSETRNISCTPVFSKIMEFFLLEKIKDEVPIGLNQFGGLKGCSTNHYLAEVWTDIMSALDTEGGVANLLSIDFAKAFNTMCHQTCLTALNNKGASPHAVRMTAAFLSNRRMQFRAGNVLSKLRPLRGGAPQGTLLGNLLFVISTDALGDETRRQETPAPLPAEELLLGLSLDRSQRIFDDCNLTATPPKKRRGLLPLNDTFQFSTPTVRGQFEPFSPPSPENEEEDDESFTYFNPRRVPLFRLSDSAPRVEDTLIRNEERVLLERRIRDGRPNEEQLGIYKYVDDFIACEHLTLNDGFKMLRQGKQRINIHAGRCQDFFNALVSKAAEVGLRVNEAKTKLLCLSAAVNSTTSSYIRTQTGSTIESQDFLKQLGFHFSSRPTVDEHVKQTAVKVRKRYWFLRHLKKAGVSSADLLHVYRSFILPIIDYSCVVYHSMVNGEQARILEKLQSSALKTIFGWQKSYEELREEHTVESITERRQRLTDDFIIKSSNNPRFGERWFPLKNIPDHDLRRERPYIELFARTDRLYRSPIFYYRRRLNELST